MYVCVCLCVCTCTLSCSVVSDYLWPQGLYPARLLYSWNFPGKNTGVGCLLQGILPTQRLNPLLLGLLHWQADTLSMCCLGWLSSSRAVGYRTDAVGWRPPLVSYCMDFSLKMSCFIKVYKWKSQWSKSLPLRKKL